MQLQLVTIAAGAFTMGSHRGQPDELPLHAVQIDQFALGAHPVTNAEYRCFVEATGHRGPGMLGDPRFALPRQPVVAVSWFDALAYCAWLTSVLGMVCRLPTEAEREKAALGGEDGLAYPPGCEPHLADAMPKNAAPNEVCSGPPNGYGLHNMGDLVHEWCSDWYAADYYRLSPTHNPAGPSTGARRTSRGGSWRHSIGVTRCAARSSLAPERTYSDYGFRVAIGAPMARL